MGDKMFPTSFDKFLPFSEFFDFTFHVHGKVFKVHRVAFAAHSPVFTRIFHAHQNEFVLEGINENIFEEIFNFIYTGRANITDKNELELLAVAKKLEIKGLQQAVQLDLNLKISPIAKNELESLKLKYDEAKYVYDKTRERLSIKNPLSFPPSRYY